MHTMLLNHIQCEMCGAMAQTLHHKNENQYDNYWKNLQPLCHSCHLDTPHRRGVLDYVPRNRILIRCERCDCLFTAESNMEHYCGDFCREAATADS